MPMVAQLTSSGLVSDSSLLTSVHECQQRQVLRHGPLGSREKGKGKMEPTLSLSVEIWRLCRRSVLEL